MLHTSHDERAQALCTNFVQQAANAQGLGTKIGKQHSVWKAGTKHIFKNTVKCSCLCKDMAKLFSKGFYNSNQCGSGTYIIVLCFQKRNYQEVCMCGW